MTSYSLATGILTLEHRLPAETISVFALVDVNLVLESLGSDQTRVGEWLNVIGYITDPAPLADSTGSNHGGPRVHAQAVLLWSAGPVDVGRYETSLKALDQASSVSDRTPS